jgi:hypothetical protein
MRLGVTGDGIPPKTIPLTPQYLLCRVPRISVYGMDLFPTVAHLSNLERVDLCRDSNHCTGILIHYTDGLAAVLGQWRIADNLQYSCIYERDKTHLSITNIYFRIAKSKWSDIVTDISFSEDRSGVVIPNTKYKVYRIGEVRSSSQSYTIY